MYEDVRDKWAARLESGRYEQAAGALRRGDSYCCLGVLCDLYKAETGDGEWAVVDGTYYFTATGGRNSSALPIPVRDWAGLDDTNPRLTDGDDGWAAYLNDHKLRFPQIAELVRKLPGARRES
jgi:hypothetical protein